MSEIGRPTVMTDEVLRKLEQVFALGGTDKEACFYAGIGTTALYEYQELHPEFAERKEMLKETPILKARETMVKALEDPVHAKWFLERKRKKEFSQLTETDITSGGEKINIQISEVIAKKNDIDASPKSDSSGHSSV